MTSYFVGTALALMSMALYSSMTLLTKLATARLDSRMGMWIALTAHLLSAAVLVLAAWLMGLGPDGFHVGPFGVFCLAGFLTSYLGRTFMFETVAQLGAARASAFQTSSPIFTALFAWPLLGERPGVNGWTAMAVTFAGLTIISSRTGGAVPSGAVQRNEMGKLLLLGIGGSAAFALGYICRAYAIRGWNEPVLGVLLGAATAFIFQAMSDREVRSVLVRFRASDAHGIRLYLAVGVISTVAQIGTISAMRYMPAAEVAVILMATPILVFPCSWLMLRQSDAIDMRAIGGVLLTLGGLGILMLRPF